MTPFNRLRRLRSKMTLTYTAVTGSVFLLLWGGLIALVISLEQAIVGSPASEPLLGIVADETAVYLSQTPIDQRGLQTYLDLWVSGDTLRIENASGTITAVYDELKFAAVADLAGNLLAVEPQALSLGSIENQLPTAVLTAYETASINGDAIVGLQAELNDELTYFQVLPIQQGNELLGVLLLANGQAVTDPQFLQELQPVFLVMSVLILVGTLVLGTIFGWLASRGLVRRLNRLETAVSAWASGDFSATVADRSADEIGQLGRNLNRMATQLDDLMTTQTALATLEERNRLARDLHDTAKQQLFAASMQLSTARALLPAQPEQADQLLSSVEKLSDQIQTELETMILALRPAALREQGLAKATHSFVQEWAERLSLKAEVAIQHERPLPIGIEQPLYRVLQESLANVAKHANASQVVVRLQYQPQAVTLRVQDNGVGFEPDDAPQGVGLQSMNERLVAINGLVTVDSQPGRGTEITAVVEVPHEDE